MIHVHLYMLWPQLLSSQFSTLSTILQLQPWNSQYKCTCINGLIHVQYMEAGIYKVPLKIAFGTDKCGQNLQFSLTNVDFEDFQILIIIAVVKTDYHYMSNVLWG